MRHGNSSYCTLINWQRHTMWHFLYSCNLRSNCDLFHSVFSSTQYSPDAHRIPAAALANPTLPSDVSLACLIFPKIDSYEGGWSSINNQLKYKICSNLQLKYSIYWRLCPSCEKLVGGSHGWKYIASNRIKEMQTSSLSTLIL